MALCKIKNSVLILLWTLYILGIKRKLFITQYFIFSNRHCAVQVPTRQFPASDCMFLSAQVSGVDISVDITRQPVRSVSDCPVPVPSSLCQQCGHQCVHQTGQHQTTCAVSGWPSNPSPIIIASAVWTSVCTSDWTAPDNLCGQWVTVQSQSHHHCISSVNISVYIRLDSTRQPVRSVGDRPIPVPSSLCQQCGHQTGHRQKPEQSEEWLSTFIISVSVNTLDSRTSMKWSQNCCMRWKWSPVTMTVCTELRTARSALRGRRRERAAQTAKVTAQLNALALLRQRRMRWTALCPYTSWPAGKEGPTVPRLRRLTQSPLWRRRVTAAPNSTTAACAPMPSGCRRN